MHTSRNPAREIAKLRAKYVLGWMIGYSCLYTLFLIIAVAVFYGFFSMPSVDSFFAFVVLGAGAIFIMYFVGLYCHAAYQKEKRRILEAPGEAQTDR